MNRDAFIASVIHSRYQSTSTATIEQQLRIAHEFGNRKYTRKQKLAALSELSGRKDLISTSKLLVKEAGVLIEEMQKKHFWDWVNDILREKSE